MLLAQMWRADRTAQQLRDSWFQLVTAPVPSLAPLPFTPPYMFRMLPHSPDFLIPEIKRTCR
jgi:hypothetical protein